MAQHIPLLDPWCVVCDRHQNRVLIHIARIDRRYIVACPMKKRSRRTATIEAAIDVAFAELCIAPQDR
jgi:hypothetical protein